MLLFTNIQINKVGPLKPNYTIAITTCPNSNVASQIADILVEKRLAACVNIIPAIESVYQWQGKIEHEKESMLVIKTEHQQLKALESQLIKLHPYDVPEFITIPIESGSKAYLEWITASLKKESS